MFLFVVALATGFVLALIYGNFIVAALFYVATGFAWRAFELRRSRALCPPIMRSPFGALLWPLRLPIAILEALVRRRRPTRYAIMGDWMMPMTPQRFPTWDAALDAARTLARERPDRLVSIHDYAEPGILYRVTPEGTVEKRNPERDLKRILGKEDARRLWPW